MSDKKEKKVDEKVTETDKLKPIVETEKQAHPEGGCCGSCS